MRAIITNNNVPFAQHFFAEGDVVEVNDTPYSDEYPTVYECICVQGRIEGLDQLVDESCFEAVAEQ